MLVHLIAGWLNLTGTLWPKRPHWKGLFRHLACEQYFLLVYKETQIGIFIEHLLAPAIGGRRLRKESASFAIFQWLDCSLFLLVYRRVNSTHQYATCCNLVRQCASWLHNHHSGSAASAPGGPACPTCLSNPRARIYTAAVYFWSLARSTLPAKIVCLLVQC